MAYYRSSDWADTLAGLFVLLMIGSWIFSSFGWWGVAVGIISLFGCVVALALIGKFIERRKEAKFVQASCKHGVAGALYGHKPCVECQAEGAAREEIARKKAQEEEALRKADKERAYKEWVQEIRLPEYLRKMHPEKFEHLVCDLFRRMGYEVKNTPFSGDGGVDGYLKKDGHLSILQCKRVKGSVGEPILRDLFGTMHAAGAKDGFVVTTGKVSVQARDWAEHKPIKILELDELVNLVRAYYSEEDVVPDGFLPTERGFSACPRCGNPLREVKGQRNRFLGCSAYPSCRYTRPLRDR